MLAPTQVNDLIPQMLCCGSAFAELINLTKAHQNRTGVLSQAVRGGGKFVDSFLKGIAFWKRAYSNNEPDFMTLVGEVQKGTKVLQVGFGFDVRYQSFVCKMLHLVRT
jgi:hypothetical protein